jgi:solute:Na+ symporter, SSS family
VDSRDFSASFLRPAMVCALIPPPDNMSAFVYSVIVVVYVLVMLAVGYWCMKRTKSVGDFFLGGRTLGPWMSAFAYGTTYFSAVLFIGYAGKLG